MKMNTDPQWLKNMAEKEDGCDVSVGSPCPADCRCERCLADSLRTNMDHARSLEEHPELRKDWETGGYQCTWEDFLKWALLFRSLPKGHVPDCDCKQCEEIRFRLLIDNTEETT